MTYPTPNSASAPAEVNYVQNESKPEQGPAALNLDTLDREGGVTQPFAVILEGKRYLFSDPQEIDWQDLMLALQDPYAFFRKILPAEDHQTFFNTRLPSWKMRALMTAYQRHYGIPVGPEGSALSR